MQFWEIKSELRVYITQLREKKVAITLFYFLIQWQKRDSIATDIQPA